MNSTSISPATRSARHLLSEGARLREWALESLLATILRWEVGVNPCTFVAGRLGPPTSTMEFGGANWSVWTNEDYVLYIRADGSDLDLDVSACGLEPALKALRWDMKMGDYPLPRTEFKVLFAQGKAKGLEVKYPIQDVATPAELKKFVLAYCDGQILCDHQVRDPNLLGVVFMPLVLGAFAIPEPKEGETPDPAYLVRESLRTDIGPEPKPEPLPPPPSRPPYPPEPAKPENWREPDPEQIRIIEDDIRWGVSAPERLPNYLEEIRLHNVGVDYHRHQALLDWEAAKAKIDVDHLKALEAHKRECQRVHDRNKKVDQALKQWTLAKLRQNALMEGFQAGRMADLGIIYEDYSKAGPRSVNGYPCFSSFRILSRNDWERARKAIIKELEHRENMEV